MDVLSESGLNIYMNGFFWFLQHDMVLEHKRTVELPFIETG